MCYHILDPTVSAYDFSEHLSGIMGHGALGIHKSLLSVKFDQCLLYNITFLLQTGKFYQVQLFAFCVRVLVFSLNHPYMSYVLHLPRTCAIFILLQLIRKAYMLQALLANMFFFYKHQNKKSFNLSSYVYKAFLGRGLLWVCYCLQGPWFYQIK